MNSLIPMNIPYPKYTKTEHSNTVHFNLEQTNIGHTRSALLSNTLIHVLNTPEMNTPNEY